MTSKELREKYIKFFKEKVHQEIPSASLVPENDSSVLFTTAGMHPLVPYLMGENHPVGKRLVNVQKCVRTGDIDDVGDSTHNTFFEMLGNWSLGDYFKEDSIRWSFEFLTDKKYLGIDPEKIKVTVFEGDDDAPRDEESIKIWQSCFEKIGVDIEIYNKEKKNNETARIFPLPKEDNWWGPAGQTGPCGPDTEIFIDLGGSVNFEKCPNGDDCKPGCHCGRYVEIWNNVFMEYEKKLKVHKVIKSVKSEYEYVPLLQKNVDTGMGLERTLAVLNGFDNIYETDVLAPIVAQVKTLSRCHCEGEARGNPVTTRNEPDNGIATLRSAPLAMTEENNKSYRIIADHIRTSVFMISDGVVPSNLDRGYILRRLLRRAIRHGNLLKMPDRFLLPLAETVIDIYKDFYTELENNKSKILEEIKKEEEKFEKALDEGLKKIDKFKFKVASFNRNIKELKQKLEFIKKNSFAENLSLLSQLDEVVARDYLIYNNFKKLFDFRKNKIDPFKDPLLPIEKQNWEKIENKSEVSDFIKKEINYILERFGIVLNGKLVFDLYQNNGFPIELVMEIAKDNDFGIDKNGFEEELKKHQQLSRTASAGKFKGGLADSSEETTRLHTTAHLLLESLRRVLGDHVFQKGSNITAERLRFDYSHSEKLTDEEKQKVEDLVNEQIQNNLPVEMEEMSLEEAKEIGAMGVFENKYGEKVKVYTIGDDNNVFSREICGGPHIKNTSELGKFRIKKEQSSSAGVRRIKAILE